MDEQQIDVQVCGGWLDSFGYEIPDAEGMRWSQFINEHLMKNCDASDRLAPLASVPLQNGKMAAKILEEALTAGYHGAMIGTQPKGGHGNLDDPDLDPFWEAASDLNATIYLHPMFGCGDARMLDYDLLNIIGRGTDTITAVSRLIYSGHLLKYSGMNFVLSHGGGGLPFLLGRMRYGQALKPQYGDPQASLDGCYYDTVVHDSNTLQFVCKQFGADRVMLGSDYPFAVGDLEPCKVVNDANLTDVIGADCTDAYNVPDKHLCDALAITSSAISVYEDGPDVQNFQVLKLFLVIFISFGAWVWLTMSLTKLGSSRIDLRRTREGLSSSYTANLGCIERVLVFVGCFAVVAGYCYWPEISSLIGL